MKRLCPLEDLLLLRGATNNDFFGSSPIAPKEQTYSWAGVGEALVMALKMEKDVSARMKLMIDVCSIAGQDDPHAADWLTGRDIILLCRACRGCC